MSSLTIKGIKSLEELINIPDRKYSIKIHNHFPYEEFNLSKEWLFGKHAYSNFGVTKEFWEATYFERESRTRATPDRWFIAESYSVTIENAITIGSSGMVVTPDGWLIKESTSLAGHWTDNRCIDIPMLLEKIKVLNDDAVHYLEGHAFIATNPSSGYGHHLTENCLPLLLFLGEPLSHILTTPGANNTIVKQWLELFNFPKENILEIGVTDFVQVKELSFYGHATHYFLNPELIRILRNNILPKYSVGKTATKKIYLNSKTSARKNHAEDDLEKFFVNKGYESVDPATLDFRQKMEKLSTAKTIAVIPGSAAWNINCFAPLDSTILYLENPNYLPSTCRINVPVDPYNYVHIEPIFPFMYDFFGYRPMSSCIPNSFFGKNLTDTLTGKSEPLFPQKSVRIPLKFTKHTKKRKNIFDVDCDIEDFERMFNLMQIEE